MSFRTRFVPIAISVLGLGVAVAQNTSSIHTTGCDASLWQHVYHGVFPTAKDRLKVIDGCVTVTGTLHYVRVEPDGDQHLQLFLDLPFRRLVNHGNMTGENGGLVIEFMCAKPPKQRDAIAEGVCVNFGQHLYKPSMNGKHVSITGAYVEDEEAGHRWREIHPVTAIRVLH